MFAILTGPACQASETASATDHARGSQPAEAGSVTAPSTVVASTTRSANLNASRSAESVAVTATDSALADQGCPSDMVLVEGEHCPEAEQICERWDPSSAPGAERCTLFHSPSRCLSKARRLMRFCIDRYEWPNRAGERPRLLTSWSDARAACERSGKRLCDETEWLFACEGPEMLPYTYGFRRDPTACVVDRFYEEPEVGAYQPWDECLSDTECLAAMKRVNQSEPAGSFARCQSPFGVFDMNGNANEWVSVPSAQYPHRSGLKGGWWGPVRSRCRPTVRFHKEDDWGYEVGFRCCQNAKP